MRKLTTGAITGVLAATVLLGGCQTPSGPASEPPAPASSTSEPATSPEPEPSPSVSPEESPEPQTLPEAVAPTAAGDNEILSPADGATVPGPRVTISGTGTAFEATLLWRVIVAGTEDVVAEDFTMAGSMGEIGPFEIEVDLEPGVYQAEVWAPDMSDGEAGGPERIDLVAVTFVVE